MKIRVGALLMLCSLTATAQVNIDNARVSQMLLDYMPGTYAFATPKVDSVAVDDKAKVVTVKFTESAAYVPMTKAQVSEFTGAVAEMLPPAYAKYKLQLVCDGKPLAQLASDADRRYVAPKEKGRFVTSEDAAPAPKGLDGTNIALWQSHGRYYSQSEDKWLWQRPNLYQTCEDLHTQSYVMPMLTPMLINAGAYVLSPLERDLSRWEAIIDNNNSTSGTRYTEQSGAKAWQDTGKPGFAYYGGNITDADNPFRAGSANMVAGAGKKGAPSTAKWTTNVPTPSEYAVYVSYQSLPNSADDAVYTVNAANGPHKVHVNQRMGGGTWVYLGHFPFDGEASVELTNASVDPKKVVTADAVKIGGGMGNVARSPLSAPDDKVDYTPVTSGDPRWVEGSRYFLQWAGAPDSVYSQTHHVNDYTDDYCSRGHWVNWLTGGSSVLPDREGLNIPIDLTLAFHTDAGITPDDSIIGTLGIYYTNDREYYANGNPRLAARDYANYVMTNIVDDVRATFEPQWTRRGMWNRNYAEARVSEAPAMLLELLSHQNLADMKYGLDPAFRFIVSRAIYKGMLEYIANRDGRPYVVQPLPVVGMSLTGKDGSYLLKWSEQVDRLEPTATPTYYIIEERTDGIGFRPIAKVTGNEYNITVTDSDIHSYRVIAANDGGVSFPSEVLALCDKPGAKQVMVVNGFTRVSAPEAFDYGEAAGFANSRDAGVPYLYDISFVGEQFEYRRDVDWFANEVAGMGASRSDYEGTVIPGNTFDFVALHGRSIADAGWGFISASADAFAVDGTDAAVVDLILGNQKEIAPGSGRLGTRYKTFPAALQNQLRAYTAKGGNVLVSGSYIATDLWNNPFSTDEVAKADKAFANEVLGYSWNVGDAAPRGEVKGMRSRYGMFDDVDFTFYDTLGSEFYAAVATDAIKAGENARPVLKYADTNLVAGTAYEAPTHRAVVVGVPFETIKGASPRNSLMAKVLEFFK